MDSESYKYFEDILRYIIIIIISCWQDILRYTILKMHYGKVA